MCLGFEPWGRRMIGTDGKTLLALLTYQPGQNLINSKYLYLFFFPSELQFTSTISTSTWPSNQYWVTISVGHNLSSNLGCSEAKIWKLILWLLYQAVNTKKYWHCLLMSASVTLRCFN